jgi:uncharacterized protein (DUF952 family)
VTRILHITTYEQWRLAHEAGVYRGDTLDTEGFIHCSLPGQIVGVANERFLGRRGLVLLSIDTNRLDVELKYEGAPGGEPFPHVYGPLKMDAVTDVLPFEPGDDGRFTLPPGLA